MLLREAEVIAILHATVKRHGTQEAAAEWFGVSGAYLCQVLYGVRPPGKKLLRRLGIRRKVMYERP